MYSIADAFRGLPEDKKIQLIEVAKCGMFKALIAQTLLQVEIDILNGNPVGIPPEDFHKMSLYWHNQREIYADLQKFLEDLDKYVEKTFQKSPTPENGE